MSIPAKDYLVGQGLNESPTHSQRSSSEMEQSDEEQSNSPLSYDGHDADDTRSPSQGRRFFRRRKSVVDHKGTRTRSRDGDNESNSSIPIRRPDQRPFEVLDAAAFEKESEFGAQRFNEADALVEQDPQKACYRFRKLCKHLYDSREQLYSDWKEYVEQHETSLTRWPAFMKLQQEKETLSNELSHALEEKERLRLRCQQYHTLMQALHDKIAEFESLDPETEAVVSGQCLRKDHCSMISALQKSKASNEAQISQLKRDKREKEKIIRDNDDLIEMIHENLGSLAYEMADYYEHENQAGGPLASRFGAEYLQGLFDSTAPDKRRGSKGLQSVISVKNASTVTDKALQEQSPRVGELASERLLRYRPVNRATQTDEALSQGQRNSQNSASSRHGGSARAEDTRYSSPQSTDEVSSDEQPSSEVVLATPTPTVRRTTDVLQSTEAKQNSVFLDRSAAGMIERESSVITTHQTQIKGKAPVQPELEMNAHGASVDLALPRSSTPSSSTRTSSRRSQSTRPELVQSDEESPSHGSTSWSTPTPPSPPKYVPHTHRHDTCYPTPPSTPPSSVPQSEKLPTQSNSEAIPAHGQPSGWPRRGSLKNIPRDASRKLSRRCYRGSANSSSSSKVDSAYDSVSISNERSPLSTASLSPSPPAYGSLTPIPFHLHTEVKTPLPADNSPQPEPVEIILDENDTSTIDSDDESADGSSLSQDQVANVESCTLTLAEDGASSLTAQTKVPLASARSPVDELSERASIANSKSTIDESQLSHQESGLCEQPQDDVRSQIEHVTAISAKPSVSISTQRIQVDEDIALLNTADTEADVELQLDRALGSMESSGCIELTRRSQSSQLLLGVPATSKGPMPTSSNSSDPVSSAVTNTDYNESDPRYIINQQNQERVRYSSLSNDDTAATPEQADFAVEGQSRHNNRPSASTGVSLNSDMSPRHGKIAFVGIKSSYQSNARTSIASELQYLPRLRYSPMRLLPKTSYATMPQPEVDQDFIVAQHPGTLVIRTKQLTNLARKELDDWGNRHLSSYLNPQSSDKSYEATSKMYDYEQHGKFAVSGLTSPCTHTGSSSSSSSGGVELSNVLEVFSEEQSGSPESDLQSSKRTTNEMINETLRQGQWNETDSVRLASSGSETSSRSVHGYTVSTKCRCRTRATLKNIWQWSITWSEQAAAQLYPVPAIAWLDEAARWLCIELVETPLAELPVTILVLIWHLICQIVGMVVRPTWWLRMPSSTRQSVLLWTAAMLLCVTFMLSRINQDWYAANTSNMRDKVLAWKQEWWEWSILQHARWHFQVALERNLYGGQQLVFT